MIIFFPYLCSNSATVRQVVFQNGFAWKPFLVPFRRIYGQTLLVQQRQREIAGLSCGRHEFHCQLHFRETLLIGRRGWIQIFERESWLAADKGTGILTQAVKEECGVNAIVHGVVTEDKRLLVLWRSGCFF